MAGVKVIVQPSGRNRNGPRPAASGQAAGRVASSGRAIGRGPGQHTFEVERTPLEGNVSGVDPIDDEDLKGGEQPNDKVTQKERKVTGERGNHKDLRQLRPVHPGKPGQRAKRHLQNVFG